MDNTVGFYPTNGSSILSGSAKYMTHVQFLINRYTELLSMVGRDVLVDVSRDVLKG